MLRRPVPRVKLLKVELSGQVRRIGILCWRFCGNRRTIKRITLRSRLYLFDLTYGNYRAIGVIEDLMRL